MELIAYRVGEELLSLAPAMTRRDWMDETGGKFANRCLPLLMANQSGWHLTGKHHLRITWAGGSDLESVLVEMERGVTGTRPASSHFGSGIVTWNVPYLFRTPPGWNLLARGPANLPKDGITALEGLVECDWAPATFTMNWQFTRPTTVTFSPGEPVALLVPQRRGELEEFNPVVSDPPDNERLGYQEWSASRARFLTGLKEGDPEAVRKGWEKDYFRGKDFAGHQMKRTLKGFTAVE